MDFTASLTYSLINTYGVIIIVHNLQMKKKSKTGEIIKIYIFPFLIVCGLW